MFLCYNLRVVHQLLTDIFIDKINELGDTCLIKVLTGMRRSGKTTML